MHQLTDARLAAIIHESRRRDRSPDDHPMVDESSDPLVEKALDRAFSLTDKVVEALIQRVNDESKVNGQLL